MFLSLFWLVLALFVYLSLLEILNMPFVEQIKSRKVKIQTKKL